MEPNSSGYDGETMFRYLINALETFTSRGKLLRYKKALGDLYDLLTLSTNTSAISSNLDIQNGH